MRAYVVHLFTVCGGGERVGLEIARALSDIGVEVVFVTNSKRGFWECAELFGARGGFEVVEARCTLEELLSLTGRFVRYRRLMLISKVYESLPPCGEDCVTIDSSTNGLFNVDIAYINCPIVLGARESIKPHWRLYNWLVSRKAWRMMSSQPGPRLVLSNSSWTRNLVRETYGVDSIVLHPPVDVEYYAYSGRPKEKIIVTTSRYTPEKNLHQLAAAASELPDYEWYIVGSTGVGKTEKHLAKTVINKIQEEAVRHGAVNLHVLADAPRGELRFLLQRALFYVHPPFPEHFGISVVEGMAAGAIPLVYRDGGAWTDIVSNIDPVLGYNNIAEVPKLIRMLESNPRLQDHLREKCVKTAWEYSSQRFREKFIEITREFWRPR